MTALGRAYAVLRHEAVPQPHFDLLIDLEDGKPLLTWRLEEWPPTTAQTAQRQEDHRRLYLTYEGEISRGRGVVRRVDQGVCDVWSSAPADWLLRFATFSLRITSQGTNLIAMLQSRE